MKPNMIRRTRSEAMPIAGTQPVLVKLTSALAPAGSAGSTWQVWNGTAYVDSQVTLTVYDSTGRHAAASGSLAWAQWQADAKRYEISGARSTAIASLTKNLTAGGPFTTSSTSLVPVDFLTKGAERDCTASTTTYDITIGRTDIYLLSCGGGWSVNDAAASGTVEVHKNGTYIGVGRQALGISSAVGDTGFSWQHSLQLTAGDVIKLMASVNNASYTFGLENPYLTVLA